MRRNRGLPSPYRVLAHHPVPGQVPDPASLIRSFNVETNPTRPIRPSPLTASTIPDMPLDLVDRLRSFPLFMTAPEEFLVTIGKHLRPQINAPNDHILTEGDEAKAMYWLVRGVVAVTSRDGEAVFAELRPGSFFGEIGVLMDVPRTATIIARTKCLVLVLKKEDLQEELPHFPDMEKAIRDEAHERLTILNKKRRESGQKFMDAKGSPISREAAPGEVSTGDVGVIKEGAVVNHKKRKSPSPGAVEEPSAGSALGSGYVNIRHTLKELPLFSTLPAETLHYLGMSAQPRTYPPFTDIIRQGAEGNEIYFIVRGEAEVVHESEGDKSEKGGATPSYVRPRLRQGQYFGEVASLGLSRGRTATVRSITTVECLMIPEEALEGLWKTCPPDIRRQVEETALARIKVPAEDVEMADATKSESRSTLVVDFPEVTFSAPSSTTSPLKDEADQLQPKDPDPFLSVDMDKLRSRRRSSLAPPISPTDTSTTSTGTTSRHHSLDAPSTIGVSFSAISYESEGPSKRVRYLPKESDSKQSPALPDDIIVTILRWLDIAELLRFRQVSLKWRRLLETSPKLCNQVDLSRYNRRVTDDVLRDIIAPFVGARAISVDISNCFHISDEGFSALWKICGRNVKVWRMRSVWDVSANQILEMSENAKDLEEVDWSNCRKVGDGLLSRVVGWVVPNKPPPTPKQVVISSSRNRGQKSQTQASNDPPPGTVLGCPQLKRLTLSYCKHITDRSMAHLAGHASKRLQYLSLTRCTSISDAGFQSWSQIRFPNLTHLYLADCTYLTDKAIVALANSAKCLTHLDLSFCCALSDTSTEVVALGLPRLQELKMAFCGSAISDNSLACIALHLNNLERLSVRGCVRVTAVGVEHVLGSCDRLTWFDVSQCRNLETWAASGAVEKWGYDEREPGASTWINGPPEGAKHRRKQPVRFVVEKGPGTLR